MNELEPKRTWKERNPWNNSFSSAKGRCNNTKHPRYPTYGGRGIRFLLTFGEMKVLWFKAEAWKMKQATIDRINPDGNYTMENCRFLEMSENVSRKRNPYTLIPRPTHCRKGHKYGGSHYNKKNKDGGLRRTRRCDPCYQEAHRRNYLKRKTRGVL